MNISNIYIGIGNLHTATNRRDCDVTKTGIVYERDEAGNATSTPKSCYIETSGRVGDTFRTRIPIQHRGQVEAVQLALDSGKAVAVTYKGFKAKLYAFTNQQGSLQSGVSCSASDFTYEVKEVSADEEFDDALIDAL